MRGLGRLLFLWVRGLCCCSGLLRGRRSSSIGTVWEEVAVSFVVKMEECLDTKDRQKLTPCLTTYMTSSMFGDAVLYAPREE